MLATIPSATLLGAEGRPVAVEVHVSNGLPGFTIVGLPDAACREARDRVRAALLSSGMTWPMRRVTVNLAPSDLRKAGASLDLAIALGLLVATGVVDPRSIEECGFIGELGLDGSIRRVPGTLALADAVASRAVVVPAQALREACLVESKRVLGAHSLAGVVSALAGMRAWAALPTSPLGPHDETGGADLVDLVDVKGQTVAKRALEVAAAGGHHLLLVGPPGAGKTMLARCLAGLVPPLRAEEIVETTKVHSAAGAVLPASGLVDRPPFRSPHHSCSAVSLLGGGTTWMRPGEVSLATNGVLFLDELGEFPPSVLDMLRQPIEDGYVAVARARASVTLPAKFLLVAATNPCPCGDGWTRGACRCSPAMRERYLRRLSSPLLDRFDLVVGVERPSAVELLAEAPALERSRAVAARVAAVRDRARARGVRCNAHLHASDLDDLAPMANEAKELLFAKVQAGELSARGLDRIRRVARTIADLDARADPDARANVETGVAAHSPELVEPHHVLEALALRRALAVLTGSSQV